MTGKRCRSKQPCVKETAAPVVEPSVPPAQMSFRTSSVGIHGGVRPGLSPVDGGANCYYCQQFISVHEAPQRLRFGGTDTPNWSGLIDHALLLRKPNSRVASRPVGAGARPHCRGDRDRSSHP